MAIGHQGVDVGLDLVPLGGGVVDDDLAVLDVADLDRLAPELAGEKNRLKLVSPRPKIESALSIGTLLTGMMVREMMFHFLPGNGMTG